MKRVPGRGDSKCSGSHSMHRWFSPSLPSSFFSFLPSFIASFSSHVSKVALMHMVLPGPWSTSVFPMDSRLFMCWGCPLLLSHPANGGGPKSRPTPCHATESPRGERGLDPGP